MEETISFGPIEMARELKSPTGTAGTENKGGKTVGLFILIGVLIASGVIYYIRKQEQKKKAAIAPSNNQPVTS